MIKKKDSKNSYSTRLSQNSSIKIANSADSLTKNSKRNTLVGYKSNLLNFNTDFFANINLPENVSSSSIEEINSLRKRKIEEYEHCIDKSLSPVILVILI